MFGSEDVRAGIRYPTRAQNWRLNILLVAVAFATLLPGLGYAARILRAAAADEDPPMVEEWWELTKAGLGMFGVLLVILLTVGASAVVLLSALNSVFSGGGLAVVRGPFTAVALLGATSVFVIGGYLSPALFANYARHGSIAEAFAYRELLEVAATPDYAGAWVAGTVAYLVGIVLGQLLLILFIGVFVGAYALVVVFYLYGRGFASALEFREIEY